jgi:hypothetical protein
MPKTDTHYPDTTSEFDLIVGGLIRKKFKRNENGAASGQGYSGPESRGWISFQKLTPAGTKRIDVVNPPR